MSPGFLAAGPFGFLRIFTSRPGGVRARKGYAFASLTAGGRAGGWVGWVSVRLKLRTGLRLRLRPRLRLRLGLIGWGGRTRQYDALA
jgi:hypothetical protein